MFLSYHLKEVSESFSLQPLSQSSVTLRISCLDNLNNTIDRLFALISEAPVPAQHAHRAGAYQEALLEKLCPYFGLVWPSARALTLCLSDRVLAQLQATPPRQPYKVLELGCGLAVPTLFLAKAITSLKNDWLKQISEFHLVGTDNHPDVPIFFNRNLEINNLDQHYAKALEKNNLSVSYRAWDYQAALETNELPEWPEFTSSKEKGFDLVMGSDILYEQKHAKAVAHSMASLVKPKGRVILADPARPYLQLYTDTMRELGFIEHTQVLKVPDEGSAPKEVFVLEFTRR